MPTNVKHPLIRNFRRADNHHIVAYLLKARTVELEKQPSLGNARNMHATIEDRYSLCGPRRDYCYATALLT
jgi:hypothetical protein